MRSAVEDLIAGCQRATREHTPALATRDVVGELVADPAALGRALGAATQGGITTLHHSEALTILRVVWTPGMVLWPHDHRMWAVIGISTGQEDNTFYRRRADGLDAVGARALTAGEVLVLGDEVIHSVANPTSSLTDALHVYGGDFFNIERSEWDAETFEERPRDLGRTQRLFDEANARWRGGA